MLRLIPLAALVSTTILIQSASAHYLWVQVDQKSSVVNLYFEGGPAPGDGQYLDPFVKRGVMWLQTPDASKPETLKLTVVKQPNKRWLRAKLTGKAPYSIDSYGKWGVYRYGKTDTLLHYYARNIDVAKTEQLTAVSKAKHLRYCIEPRFEDGQLIARVTFNGKPSAGDKFIVRGPGVKENVKTDANGEVKFKVGKPGRYILRSFHDEGKKPGQFEGKSYEKIYHNSTLIIRLPL